MARSFDDELLDKMLMTPFLPDDLIERLHYAKGIVMGVAPATHRTTELELAAAAIDNVIKAVNHD